MEFPKINPADERACFKKLFQLVHPEGPRCPECRQQEGLRVFRRHKQSWVLDYRCPHCRCVFNAWTGTPFQGTHHSPSELWHIILRIKQGISTSAQSREFDFQRARLSELHKRIQRWVTNVFGPPPKKTPRKRPGRKKSKPPSTRKRRP